MMDNSQDESLSRLRIMEEAERQDTIEATKEGIADMEAGRTRTAEEVHAELRKLFSMDEGKES